MEEKVYEITENKVNPSKVVKKFDFKLQRDDSLHLLSQKRVFADNSTDNFTKLIFAEDKYYYLFLNYVNFLGFYGEYLTNLHVVSHEWRPVSGDEEIELYFKGGNVLNYHFNKIISNERIKEIFSKYFKKSDFDFSVNIMTKTDHRFQVFRKFVYQNIIRFLKKTSDCFNMYLEKVLSEEALDKPHPMPKNFRNSSYDDDHQTLIRLIKEMLDESLFEIFYIFIKHYFYKYGNTKIVPPIEKIHIIEKYIHIDWSGQKTLFYTKHAECYFLKYNPEVIAKLNKILKMYNEYVIVTLQTIYFHFYQRSKYHSMLLYPYYRYLIYPIETHEIEYETLLDEMIQYNFDLIQHSNFYSLEKIEELYENIYQSLGEIEGEYYQIDSHNPPDITEMQNTRAFQRFSLDRNAWENGKSDMIHVGEKEDYIVYTDFNSPEETHMIHYRSPYTKNYHYIGVNYSIKNFSEMNSTTDFDLLRIKLQIEADRLITKNNVLKKSFSVPSEFIDISITNFKTETYGRKEEIYLLDITLPDIILPQLTVKTHSYFYFIMDLIQMLFVDYYFIPWEKMKYEKRLYRLLLFIYIYDKKEGTSLFSNFCKLAKAVGTNLSSPENRQICLDHFKDSSVFVSTYQDYQDIYDLVYIKAEFAVIEKPIALMIIMESVLKLSNREDIINYFRQKLNLAPITNFKKLEAGFFTFLELIQKIYDEVNGEV